MHWSIQWIDMWNFTYPTANNYMKVWSHSLVCTNYPHSSVYFMKRQISESTESYLFECDYESCACISQITEWEIHDEIKIFGNTLY